MKSKEYSAYIKGLIDGANIDTTTSEGKVIAALAELAGQMADEIEELTKKVETCNAYIEEIDEDLGAVEEIVYDIDDDDDDDDCCCGCHGDDDDDCDCDCCDCDCDDCDCDCDQELSFDCPNCGKTVMIKASDIDFDESPVCSACGQPFFVDVEDEDEE